VPLADCKTIEELTIHKGDIYTITLNENPSTGYTWSVTSSDGLEIFSEKLTPSINCSLGSTGASEVKLQAVKTCGKNTGDKRTEFTVYVTPSAGLKIISEEPTPSINCSSRSIGIREVKFEAVKTGKQNITGKYQQVWNKLPIQSFEIAFNVV